MKSFCASRLEFSYIHIRDIDIYLDIDDIAIDICIQGEIAKE